MLVLGLCYTVLYLQTPRHVDNAVVSTPNTLTN